MLAYSYSSRDANWDGYHRDHWVSNDPEWAQRSTHPMTRHEPAPNKANCPKTFPVFGLLIESSKHIGTLLVPIANVKRQVSSLVSMPFTLTLRAARGTVQSLKIPDKVGSLTKKHTHKRETRYHRLTPSQQNFQTIMYDTIRLKTRSDLARASVHDLGCGNRSHQPQLTL